jgi:putative transposase
MALLSRKRLVLYNHFQLRRHRLPASEYRAARDRAFATWRDATGADLVG